MELAGGILTGMILMFSLLAFYPADQPSWLDVFNKLFVGSEQVAQIGNAEITVEPKKQAFSLSSTAFRNGNTLLARHTCDGAGISLPLSISGVPEKTQSLVLLVEDQDAPKGVWVHWLVFNIPPTVRQISEGKEPPGRAGENSWREKEYRAPCPSLGKEHKYIFRLYALSRTQALKVGSTKEEVLADMKGFLLAQTELTARYKRIK